MTELALDPLLARLAGGRQPWVLLVDGRSGAGKTVLATRIAEATGASLVSLDDDRFEPPFEARLSVL